MCDVCFCKIVEGYGQTECTTSGTLRLILLQVISSFVQALMQANLLTKLDAKNYKLSKTECKQDGAIQFLAL